MTNTIVSRKSLDPKPLSASPSDPLALENRVKQLKNNEQANESY